MRIYVETNGKKTSFGYRELAEKMWFKEKNGKELEISHAGNDESLQNNFELAVSLDKWLNDKRWSKVETKIYFEYIELKLLSDRNIIEIVSTHTEIMTIDKRAMYIMIVEIAKELDGKISEDNMNTWLTVDEFKKKHQVVLNLTYEEANEISLKEAPRMEAIEEPWDDIE